LEVRSLFSYIPDPPDRGEAFEPLLDDLVAIFCQGQGATPNVAENATATRYARCTRMRAAVGRAAAQDLDLVRANAALVLAAAVHDQCRSGNRKLVDPLVAALGYRPVQVALIGYVENGTDAEAIGATMAWYWARPQLVYLGAAKADPDRYERLLRAQAEQPSTTITGRSSIQP